MFFCVVLYKLGARSSSIQWRLELYMLPCASGLSILPGGVYNHTHPWSPYTRPIDPNAPLVPAGSSILPGGVSATPTLGYAMLGMSFQGKLGLYMPLGPDTPDPSILCGGSVYAAPTLGSHVSGPLILPGNMLQPLPHHPTGPVLQNAVSTLVPLS